MDRIVDSYVHRSPPAYREKEKEGRERERARERERERERGRSPGTIVESWESSDYIRPINFFAGTDPTVSHGVSEAGEEKERERERERKERDREEAAAAALLLLLPFFRRARLARRYNRPDNVGMRPANARSSRWNDAAPRQIARYTDPETIGRSPSERASERLIRPFAAIDAAPEAGVATLKAKVKLAATVHDDAARPGEWFSMTALLRARQMR